MGLFPSNTVNLSALNEKQQGMASELLNPHDQSYGKGVQHLNYISKLGKILNPHLCKDYTIQNSQCQSLLQRAEYYFDEAIGLNEKVLQIFYEKNYTCDDFKRAIGNSVQQKQYLIEYFETAKINMVRFMNEMHTNQKISEACCLAISYYTGFFQQSLDRDSNFIIKLTSLNVIECIKNSKELQDKMCMGHWLLKAISHLPVHVGKVTRYIQLKEEEESYYQEGNMVTWLQFSSSSQGGFIPKGYQRRNTRFHIFSITGRKISEYSTYKQLQKQVLFKPFSHFLVLKKEKIYGILHIHMRQIAIGQSSLNILWVDDKIFSPQWKYKDMVQSLIKMNPRINIIPKSSTKAAMAFINSQLGNKRKKKELRIVTTLERENQENRLNAGAVLLKKLQEIVIVNLKMMIITSNPEAAKAELKKLLVRQLLLSITSSDEELYSFISFK